MSRLILVKHASPVVDPTISSKKWVLSDAGKIACVTLAARLKEFEPTRIFTSTELKAIETGQLLGEALNIQSTSTEGLHEHDRSNVPHLRTGDFLSSVANFFKQPDRLVLGMETATGATDRIEQAVSDLVSPAGLVSPSEPVSTSDLISPSDLVSTSDDTCTVVVTHGTVLALLAHRKLGLEPFALFRAMKLPSYLVVDLPHWTLVERADQL